MAEAEIVGQYFFNFGVRTVKGDFSSSERLYEIAGVYATGQDFNFEPPFDPNKRIVQSRSTGSPMPGTIQAATRFTKNWTFSIERLVSLSDPLRQRCIATKIHGWRPRAHANLSSVRQLVARRGHSLEI